MIARLTTLIPSPTVLSSIPNGGILLRAAGRIPFRGWCAQGTNLHLVANCRMPFSRLSIKKLRYIWFKTDYQQRMTKATLNKIGYCTALLTFLIATLILFAYYEAYQCDYERYGLLFIPVAFVLNLIVLVMIIVISRRRQISGPFYSIHAMLLNIPYAFFCIWFALFLMSYYRVTVVNDTDSEALNIRFSGCDKEVINRLDVGESETVWIELENDCTLHMRYLMDGVAREDQVAGYLSSGMGHPATYYLSGRDNPKY